MNRTVMLKYCAAPVLFTVICLAPAEAQVITSGQNPLDNAAAAGARAPGDMVIAGVAQAAAFANAGRAGVEITETTRPTSVRAQALADSIAILFEQLNQAIAAFQSLLLLRSGSSPSVFGLPSILGTGGTDSGGTAEPSGGRRKLTRRDVLPSRTTKSRLPI